MDQLDYLELLNMAVNLEGKDVLEVGGAIPPSKALSLKVKTWTSIDISERRLDNEEHLANEDPRYRALLMNAEKMSFEGRKFDVVFSGNCFEHISDLPAALREINRVLRDDGILFSKFSPIWSSPIGHHTWVRDGGDIVGFDQPGGVFPDWYHLSKTEDEFLAYLDAKYKPELRDSIFHYVHHSSDLNRWVDTQYLEEIGKYNYQAIINHTIKCKGRPPADQLAAMKQRYPKVTDFRTLGFYWVLSKKRPSIMQYLRGYLGSSLALFKIKFLRYTIR